MEAVEVRFGRGDKRRTLGWFVHGQKDGKTYWLSKSQTEGLESGTIVSNGFYVFYVP